MKEIRLAAIEHDSVVNGKGVRTVFYTQGCNHHCVGCHNPSTWSFEGGRLYSFTELLKEVEKNKLSKSITWSGGDPLYQKDIVLDFNKKFKELGYDIWLYTGFLYEEIDKKYLYGIDVLVDGMFEIDKKTLDKPFVGSYNQRVIDINKSSDKVILLEGV